MQVSSSSGKSDGIIFQDKNISQFFSYPRRCSNNNCFLCHVIFISVLFLTFALTGVQKQSEATLWHVRVERVVMQFATSSNTKRWQIYFLFSAIVDRPCPLRSTRLQVVAATASVKRSVLVVAFPDSRKNVLDLRNAYSQIAKTKKLTRRLQAVKCSCCRHSRG